MKHDKNTGLIDCRQIGSPNYDQRSVDAQIEVLVIHAISLPPQCYGNNYVEDFFQNTLDKNAHPYFEDIADRNVSSHFYIKRGGELIQFVSTSDRAWHAGESDFKERKVVNDFSIGIELEGCDEHQFESVQYSKLVALTHCLQRSYPLIDKENIVGHSDISPGRKTDPGLYFDWNVYLESI